ncbi:hypothetical protein IAU60_003685 [Kwoniella sp. DSM 27419]
MDPSLSAPSGSIKKRTREEKEERRAEKKRKKEAKLARLSQAANVEETAGPSHIASSSLNSRDKGAGVQPPASNGAETVKEKKLRKKDKLNGEVKETKQGGQPTAEASSEGASGKKAKSKKEAGKALPSDERKAVAPVLPTTDLLVKGKDQTGNQQALQSGQSGVMRVNESKEEKKARKAEKAQRKLEKAAAAAATQAGASAGPSSASNHAPPLTQPSSKVSVAIATPTPSSNKDKGKAKASEPAKPTQVSSKVSIPIDPVPVARSTQKRKRPLPSQTVADMAPQGESSTSTPIIPSRKIITTGPVRSPMRPSPSAGPKRPRPTSTPRGSVSGTQRSSQDKIDDDVLKKMLNGPRAVEQWLSSNWSSEKEIRRLEKAGVLTFKKGKFSPDEQYAIRRTLENYQKVHKMTDDQLVEQVMSKAGDTDMSKDDYQTFWLDVAAAVPGRPVVNVQFCAQRMYDPKGHKGPWTAEEDEALLRAYDKFPNQWSRLSEIVDRTANDCKDRYMKELSSQADRTTGAWSKEEGEQLIASVEKMNRSLGRRADEREDIPWSLVAKDMGGTRSAKQCRTRWSEVEVPRLDGMIRMGQDESLRLLEKIEAMNFKSDKAIDWDVICQDPEWKHHNRKSIRMAFHRLKQRPEQEPVQGFSDLLQRMKRDVSTPRSATPARTPKPRSKKQSEDKTPSKKTKTKRKEVPDRQPKSKEMIDTDDEEDEERNERELTEVEGDLAVTTTP